MLPTLSDKAAYTMLDRYTVLLNFVPQNRLISCMTFPLGEVSESTILTNETANIRLFRLEPGIPSRLCHCLFVVL